MIKAKHTNGLVFVSSNDCISCTSYVSSAYRNNCNLLFSSDKEVFYSYLHEMGIDISADKIVKDKKVLTDIITIFKTSKLFVLSNDSIIVHELNSRISNFCNSNKKAFDEKINTVFIPLPDSINASDFQEYVSMFNAKNKSYSFFDKRYNFEYKLDSSFKYTQKYVTIDQATQNRFYKIIEKEMNLPNIVYADSNIKEDANFYLKYMAQPKMNILYENDSFMVCYINYCIKSISIKDSSNIKDTSIAVDILKVVGLIKKSGDQLNILKFMDKLVINGQTYYVRPYNVKINNQMFILPFVNTDSIGQTFDTSNISLAVFNVNDNNIYDSPVKFFNTKIKHANYKNVRFDMYNDTFLVFDNFNKIINLYSSADKKGKLLSTYKALNLYFVYDVNCSESLKFNLIYTSTDTSSHSGQFNILSNKININSSAKISDYFLGFSFFNLNKVNGYAIDKTKNGILFFRN